MLSYYFPTGFAMLCFILYFSDMKILLDIAPEKTDFVLELLQNFDFVRVEEVSEELTDAHKAIIDRRLADYRANPDSALDWEDVKREPNKRKWSGGLSDETADKMLAYVEKSRQEWEERH